MPVSMSTYGPDGGVGELQVGADPSDQWFIESAPDWVTVVKPWLGLFASGPGRATFIVHPNAGAQARDGVIVDCRGEFTHTIHQAGRASGAGRHVTGDFDGDGKADLAIRRPPPRTFEAYRDREPDRWYVLPSRDDYRYSSAVGFELKPGENQFEVPNVPLSADFDGDGKSDLAMVYYRSGIFTPLRDIWRSFLSSNPDSGYNEFSFVGSFSGADDRTPIPVVADFGGHGQDDLASFNPPDGVWRVRFSHPIWNPATGDVVSAPRLDRLVWGTRGDIPIGADFDGDGKADACVWRPTDGRWYILYSKSDYSYGAASAMQWGTNGDVPINGDFDGDGRHDLAVWRPSSGTWFVLLSSTAFDVRAAVAHQWGAPGDIPVAADYDGDGSTDLAIWRPATGTWYLLFSSTGYAYSSAKSIQWGNAALGDQPIRR
jgi:VCBS repeat protein/FG-GAP repeat protein